MNSQNFKRRTASNGGPNIHLRTKSQQSSQNASALKEAHLNKLRKAEQLEREKMEKSKNFAGHLKTIRNESENRCKIHMVKTIEPCDRENAGNVQNVCEFTRDIMKHFMDTE